MSINNARASSLATNWKQPLPSHMHKGSMLSSATEQDGIRMTLGLTFVSK